MLHVGAKDSLEQAGPADTARPGLGMLELALGGGGFGDLLRLLGPLGHHLRPQLAAPAHAE